MHADNIPSYKVVNRLQTYLGMATYPLGRSSPGPRKAPGSQLRDAASVSKFINKWRRRESNPGPKMIHCRFYVRIRFFYRTLKPPTGRVCVGCCAVLFRNLRPVQKTEVLTQLNVAIQGTLGKSPSGVTVN